VTTLYVTHDQTEAMTLGLRVAVLRRGRIQQVDTPQRLYRKPANTFVASFIGSPPMSFAEGRFADGAVELGPYTLPLPEPIRARLERREGAVVVGLRPEHFHDARLGTRPDAATLPADVDITEQLGPETFAYLRIPGLQAVEVGERPLELAGAFAARLDARSQAAPGERLTVAVDLDEVQLFDPESGSSLLRD
jgi:multiple sugar transport system ATP-binding protein